MLIRNEADALEAIRLYGVGEGLKANCTLSPEMAEKIADHVAKRSEALKEYLGYKPNAKQIEFHNSHKRFKIAFGGNRCLGPDTVIESTDGDRKVSEIRGRHRVKSWSGETMIICEAEEPFIKGYEECYRVFLSNGRWFDCSAEHRVALSDMSYGAVGELLKSVPCLLASTWDTSPATHLADDPHSTCIVPDLKSSCCSCLRPCGGRLQAGVGIGQVSSPSTVYEAGHTFSVGFVQTGDLVDTRECSRLHQSIYRLSSSGVQSRFLAPFAGFLSRVSSLISRLSDWRNRVFEQPSHVSPLLPQPIFSQFGPANRAPVYLFSSQPPFGGDKFNPVTIISYMPIGVKPIFDFNVPKFHNYSAAGIVHHNSGKSRAVRYEIETHLLREYPSWWKGKRFYEPLRIRMCAPSYEKGLSDVMIPGFQKELPSGFIKEVKRNTSGQTSGLITVNGDYIQFMSYNQDVQDYASDSFDIVGEDEPPPKGIHVENCMRIADRIDRGSYLMMGATVLRSHAWVYDDYGDNDDPNVFVTHFATAENPIMTTEMVTAMEGLIKSPEERATRIYGLPSMLSGIIFKEFNRSFHTCPSFRVSSPDYTEYMGIDYHSRKSWAMKWWAINAKEQKFVTDEVFENIHTIRDAAIAIAKVEGRITEQEAISCAGWDEKVLKSFLWQKFHGSGRLIWARIVDTSINVINPATGDSILIELSKYGIHCIPANKDIDAGLEKLHDWLKVAPSPEFFIQSHCTESIYQYEHYVWDEYGTDQSYEKHDPKAKPRKKRDDMIDLDRYFANYQPRYRLPRPQQYRAAYVPTNPVAGI